MKPFMLFKNTYEWFISEYEKGTLKVVFDDTKVEYGDSIYEYRAPVKFSYKGESIIDECSITMTLIKMYKLYGVINES